jgi:ABC-2 type transport system ATP-binding protein
VRRISGAWRVLVVIQAEGLRRTFGSVHAVEGLSFEVGEGEVFGLLGPNGAGKTTTIRLLACLIRPTGGSAKVCGFSITSEPTKVRKRVGILTENPSLYERLTAQENMEFFAKAYGVPAANIQPRITELLEFFDLQGRGSEVVGRFSRGMKQKLSIARALVHSPPVLLLDEPTANLDPESSKEVRTMIIQLSKREKCVVLLSTHRLDDAEKLCDHVMVIHKGRSIAVDSPEALRKKMAGPQVLEVQLRNENASAAEAVRHFPSVKSFQEEGKRLLLTLDDHEASTPGIVAAIVAAGGQILSVYVRAHSLEDAYLKLISEEKTP